MAGFTPYLGLILLLLITEQTGLTTADNHHICKNLKPVKDVKTDYCGNYQQEIIEFQYIADKESEPLTHYPDVDQRFLYLTDCAAKYMADMEDGHLDRQHDMCTYFTTKEEEVEECCRGWGGPDCDQPICEPPCENGGTCQAPDLCACPSGFVGPDCSQNQALVTDDMAYCFLSSGECFGEKVEGGVMSKADCCKEGVGSSWGISESDNGVVKCEQCFLTDINVVNQAYDLPYRTCLNSGEYLYRTFDGSYFYFPGKCSYLLVASGNDFEIDLHVIDCENSFSDCKKKVVITFAAGSIVQSIELFGNTVKVNDQFVDVCMTPKKVWPMSDISMQISGDFIMINYNSKGLKIKFDMKDSVYVTLDKNFHHQQTSGLCGFMDDNPANDLQMKDGTLALSAAQFGNSWAIPQMGKPCPDVSSCTDKCQGEEKKEAQQACSMIRNYIFKDCAKKVDAFQYFKMCVNQYCDASDDQKQYVVCAAIESFARECASFNFICAWRSQNFCPKTCPTGMVYHDCVPTCPRTCSVIHDYEAPERCTKDCFPGCMCPLGTYIQDGKCVKANECECTYQETRYKHNSNIKQKCNSCTCDMGKWICTHDVCSSTCSVIGLGNIITFDGKDYKMKPCRGKYTLIEPLPGAADSKANIIVEAVYGPCTKDICDVTSGLNCVKSVEITAGDTYIEITSSYNVYINDEDATESLPVNAKSVYIKRASSDFIVVVAFGIQIKFTPRLQLYINVSPYFSNKIRGLCGKYNHRCDDDMTTRMDMIEMKYENFASSYCTPIGAGSLCPADVVVPCSNIGSSFMIAENDCKCITQDVDMMKCHNMIKPAMYYDKCLQDSCSRMHPDVDYETVCYAIISYAYDCANEGIFIDITKFKQCKFHERCTGGTAYSVCSSNCRGSCRDLEVQKKKCDDDCIPGCACPPGQYLTDGPSKTCVPIEECTCYDEFSTDPIRRAGEVIEKNCGSCTCLNGTWHCDSANCHEEVVCPKNQVYGPMNPSCEQTCFNVDRNVHCKKDPGLHKGCVCPDGLVKGPDGTCIPDCDCPCQYNGGWKEPGSIVRVGCTEYKCVHRSFVKSQGFPCPGYCYAAGDPHLRTFDGITYSFQGTCSYVFAKDRINNKFEIQVENVQCGTTDVSCTKSVWIILYGTIHIHLVRGVEAQLGNQSMGSQDFDLSSFSMYQGGMFTIVHAHQLGLMVLWDKGTRLYVFLDETMWMDKVEGLCGDFNGRSTDEFDGMSVYQFGNSWKVGTDCPDVDPLPYDQCEPCAGPLAPRKKWAHESCSIIKTGPLFCECRDKMEQDRIDYFYDRCVEDACKCDRGGDCECLCTILALFAQDCARIGAPTKWRSQNLCPMMCENGMVYSPCEYACPATCRNIGGDNTDELCANTACIEGCFCPEGTLRQGDECVSAESCSCYQHGTVFPPGTIMTDHCQTCTCIMGKFDCVGDICPDEGCDDGMFACDMGTCIDMNYLCDGFCDCIDQSDEENCTMEFTCAPDEFRCLDGHCISKSCVCDGEPDCADHSDEDDCDMIGCADDEFPCGDGHCIPIKFKCDGEPDCGAFDNSDEDDCKELCPQARYFTCIDGQGVSQCYPDVVRCDGHDDCGDGSDEFGCIVNCTCGQDYVQCKDTCMCIHLCQLCDGVDDCNDGSDEGNCGDCSHDEFSCDFNKCLPAYKVCDTFFDCDDGTDETHPSCLATTSAPAVTTTPPCEPPNFACMDGECIEADTVCDTICDCSDCGDEENCQFTTPAYGPPTPECNETCADDEMQCSDCMCIHQYEICDGLEDCPEGEDENNCPGQPTEAPRTTPGCNTTCSESEYQCRDCVCINQEEVCDGYEDCTDGDDEQNCAGQPTEAPRTTPGCNTTCSENEYQCRDCVCINLEEVCDGYEDCTDGDDEQNCAVCYDMDGDKTGLTIKASSQNPLHPARDALRRSPDDINRFWQPWTGDSDISLTVTFSGSLYVESISFSTRCANTVHVECCGITKDISCGGDCNNWSSYTVLLGEACNAGDITLKFESASGVMCVQNLYLHVCPYQTASGMPFIPRPSISISGGQLPSISISGGKLPSISISSAECKYLTKRMRNKEYQSNTHYLLLCFRIDYFELDYDSAYLSITASSEKPKDGLLAVYALRRTPSIDKYWSPWNDNKPKLKITIKGSVLVKKITMDVMNVDKIIVECSGKTKAVVCGPKTSWTHVCIVLTQTCLAGRIIIAFKPSRGVNDIRVKNLFITVASKPIGGCYYGEIMYNDDDDFPCLDGCNRCRCRHSKIMCTKHACHPGIPVTLPVPIGPHGNCHYHLLILVVGDSCSADDGCNTCYCDAVSGLICTSDYCGPHPATNIPAIVQIPEIAIGGCIYGHMPYDDGADFPCSDGCNKCKCRHSKIMCTAITCVNGVPGVMPIPPGPSGSCHYYGLIVIVGHGCTAHDGCNTCYCDAHCGLICTTDYCGKYFELDGDSTTVSITVTASSEADGHPALHALRYASYPERYWMPWDTDIKMKLTVNFAPTVQICKVSLCVLHVRKVIVKCGDNKEKEIVCDSDDWTQLDVKLRGCSAGKLVIKFKPRGTGTIRVGKLYFTIIVSASIAPGFELGGCYYGEIMYHDDDDFPCLDGCNRCRCRHSKIMCTKIVCKPGIPATLPTPPGPQGSCHYHLLILVVGDSCSADDGCNTCYCDGVSGLICTSDYCGGHPATNIPAIVTIPALTVGGCLYGHVSYDDDAEFPCSDGINRCKCRHSKIMCTVVLVIDGVPGTMPTPPGPNGSCHYYALILVVGDSCTAHDGCNSCYCDAHCGLICTTDYCGVMPHRPTALPGLPATPIGPNGNCHYHLLVLVVGDSCSADDGCNTCYCDGVSGLICTTDYCGVGGCLYGHVSYDDDAEFPCSDGINRCKCRHSKIMCTVVLVIGGVPGTMPTPPGPNGSCHYYALILVVGDSCTAHDGCNSCYCDAHCGLICTTDYCGVGGCYYGEIMYHDDDDFPCLDGCNRCRCRHSKIMCTKIVCRPGNGNCHYHLLVLVVGDSCSADDGCNTCYCDGVSGLICTTDYCGVGGCLYGHVSYDDDAEFPCSDGINRCKCRHSKIMCTVVLVIDGDGSCHYYALILVVGDSCTAHDGCNSCYCDAHCGLICTTDYCGVGGCYYGEIMYHDDDDFPCLDGCNRCRCRHSKIMCTKIVCRPGNGNCHYHLLVLVVGDSCSADDGCNTCYCDGVSGLICTTDYCGVGGCLYGHVSYDDDAEFPCSDGINRCKCRHSKIMCTVVLVIDGDGSCHYYALILVVGDSCTAHDGCNSCYCDAHCGLICTTDYCGVGGCYYGEIMYHDDDDFPCLDGCNRCRCRHSKIMCTKIVCRPGNGNCHYHLLVLVVGDSCSADDGCNTCYCDGVSGLICTTDYCGVGGCLYGHVSYDDDAEFPCSDGINRCKCRHSKIMCTVVLVIDGDGSCHYYALILVVGDSCTAHDGCNSCYCDAHCGLICTTDYCGVGGCYYGEIMYHDDDDFPCLDGCNRCRCRHSKIMCTKIVCRPGNGNCHYHLLVLVVGDSCSADDGCNTCYCDGVSGLICTTDYCGVGGCLYGHVSYDDDAEFPCSDGINRCKCRHSKIMCTVVLVIDGDGSCHYYALILVVGDSCTAHDGCNSCYCDAHCGLICTTDYCGVGGCYYGEIMYHDDDDFPCLDGCNRCRCRHSKIMCTKIVCRPGNGNCHYHLLVLVVGDSCSADDGCNTCYCDGVSGLICTTDYCGVGGCLYGHVSYDDDAEFPCSDGINRCKCRHSKIMCTVVLVIDGVGGCYYGEIMYHDDDDFPCLDGCNRCRCRHSKIMCTKIVCKPGIPATLPTPPGPNGNCHYHLLILVVGDSCSADDGCNTCYCDGVSGLICTSDYCGGHPGTNIPAIVTIPALTVGGCLYGHVSYDDDAEFPCSDGINRCKCRHSKIMCTVILIIDGVPGTMPTPPGPHGSCHYYALILVVGDSCTAHDGCNTCYCDEHCGLICTTDYCGVTTRPTTLLPGLPISSMEFPSISVSSMEFPSISVPSISISSMGLPSISISSMGLPSISISSMGMPSISISSAAGVYPAAKYFELDGDSTTVSITVTASSEADGHPAPHALRYASYPERYWMPWDTDSKPKLIVQFAPTVQICKVSLCVLHVKKVIVKCGDNKEKETVCDSDNWTQLDIKLRGCSAGQLVIKFKPRGTGTIRVKKLYFTIIVSSASKYFELDGDSTTVSITVTASSEADGHPAPHALRYASYPERYWMPWDTDSKLKLTVQFAPTVQICKVSLCVLHVKKVIVKCGDNKEKETVCDSDNWTQLDIKLRGCSAGQLVIKFKPRGTGTIRVKKLYFTIIVSSASTPGFEQYFELDGDSTTVSITVTASSEADGHPAPHALRYASYPERYWMPWDTDSKPKLIVQFAPTVQICKVSLCVLHVKKVIVKCGDNKEKETVCDSDNWTQLDIKLRGCSAGQLVIKFKPRGTGTIRVKKLYFTIIVSSVSLSSVSISGVSISGVARPSISISSFERPSISISSFERPSISISSMKVSSIGAPSVSISSIGVPSISISSMKGPSISISSVELPSISISTIGVVYQYFELDYDSPYLSIMASSEKPKDGLLAVYALRRTPSIDKYWSPWNDNKPRLCITIKGSVLVKKITMDVKNVNKIIVNCGTLTRAVVCGPKSDWTTVCIMMTDTCLAGKIIISFIASSDINLIMVKNLYVTVASKPSGLALGLEVSSVSLPSVSFPSVSVSSVSIPSWSLPSVSFSSVEVPSVTIPSYSGPSMSIHTIPSLGIPPSGGCFYGSVMYNDGDSFPAGDGCNTCTCRHSKVMCTLIACTPGIPNTLPTPPGPSGSCHYLAIVLMVGESCSAGDGCNICTCDGQSGLICTSDYCGSAAVSKPPMKIVIPSITVGGCFYYDVPYGDGDEFPCSDGCNTCRCRHSKVMCTRTSCLHGVPGTLPPVPGPSGSCHYHAIIIVVGDSCSAGDGCNTCYCDADSGLICTTDFCGNPAAPPPMVATVAPAFAPKMIPTPFLPPPLYGCYYFEISYNDGDSFQCMDGCNQCTCRHSKVMCSKRACIPGAKETLPPPPGPSGKCSHGSLLLPVGDSCSAGDGCNTCYCDAIIGIVCTTDYCGAQPITELPAVIQIPDIAIGGCSYGVMAYGDGDEFECSDHCNKCRCRHSKVMCTIILCLPGAPASIPAAPGPSGSCQYHGMSISVGNSCTADDGCNTCYCHAVSGLICTTDYCGHHAPLPQPLPLPHIPVHATNVPLPIQGIVLDKTPTIGGCYYGDQLYYDDDNVPCSDGCNKCRCKKSKIMCTNLICHPNMPLTLPPPPGPNGNCHYYSLVLSVGDSCSDNDGCNTCYCDILLGVICTTDYCGGHPALSKSPVILTIPALTLGGCRYGDMAYDDGDDFPCSDGCNTCKCRHSAIMCTTILCVNGVPKTGLPRPGPNGNCHYHGILIIVGDSCTAGDGCNTCYCDEISGIICTTNYCGVTSISVSSVSVPSISISSVGVPSISVSGVGVPSISVSGISGPSISVSSFGLPSISVSGISGPSISVSSFGRPSISISSIGRPSISISSFGLPSVSISGVTVPSISISSVGAGVMVCPIEMKDGNSPDLSISASSSAPSHPAEYALRTGASNYWQAWGDDNQPTMTVTLESGVKLVVVRVTLYLKYVERIKYICNGQVQGIQTPSNPSEWCKVVLPMKSKCYAGDIVIVMTPKYDAPCVKDLFVEVCSTAPKYTTEVPSVSVSGVEVLSFSGKCFDLHKIEK
ncbi:hypothetical protein ScPMuIL_015572 [Solemya velum]